MTKPKRPPDLDEGAVELLRVACENDEHKALASNAALSVSLGFIGELITACRSDQVADLQRLLRLEVLPQHFLSLVASVLRTIRDRLDREFGATVRVPGFEQMAIVSDFDHFAMQGVAHALAERCWFERRASAAEDFNGPGLSTCRSRIANCEAMELRQLLIQHYVAEILQYNFAAARLRERMPDLDPRIEVDLRSQDARKIAAHTVRLSRAERAEPSVKELMLAFQSVVNEIVSG